MTDGCRSTSCKHVALHDLQAQPGLLLTVGYVNARIRDQRSGKRNAGKGDYTGRGISSRQLTGGPKDRRSVQGLSAPEYHGGLP